MSDDIGLPRPLGPQLRIGLREVEDGQPALGQHSSHKLLLRTLHVDRGLGNLCSPYLQELADLLVVAEEHRSTKRLSIIRGLAVVEEESHVFENSIHQHGVSHEYGVGIQPHNRFILFGLKHHLKDDSWLATDVLLPRTSVVNLLNLARAVELLELLLEF